MKPITTFAEAHAALRRFYGNSRNTYDLTIMRQLMKYLGNPQDKLRVIHVAGTSGKTSTAYYVSALLEASGVTVGLTVSPHVDEVNERVQINHVPLPEKEFCGALEEFINLLELSGINPSYFEVMIAFAYWQFARQRVDYAVIETGLGGLLDGTNVVNREDKLCVITDIGLDHTEVLGNTLEEIALQKAGIVQPGNPVYMYKQAPEVMSVLKKVCHQKGAILHAISSQTNYGRTELPLFQQRNFGLAKEATEYVLQRDGKVALSSDQITLASLVHIPARMERFKLSDKTLLVDGSHNVQKLSALKASMRAAYPRQKVAVLAAFVEGNDARWQGGMDVLLTLAERIIITTFKSEQDVPKAAVDPTRVADYCRDQGFETVKVQRDPGAALQELQASEEPVLLVAGSFYLLNSIRPLIVDI